MLRLYWNCILFLVIILPPCLGFGVSYKGGASTDKIPSHKKARPYRNQKFLN